MEYEYVDEDDCEQDVSGVEDPIVPMPDEAKGCCAHGGEHDETDEAGDHVHLADPLGENAGLDEKVEIEHGMQSKENCKDLPQKLMDCDDSLVGQSS